MHRSLIPVLGVPVIMPFQGDVSGQRVEDERQSAAQNRQRQRAALLRLQQSCAEVAEEVERKKRSLMDALREQKTLKGRMREVEIQQMGVRPGETEPYDSFTEAAISEIMSDDASGSVAAGLEDDDDATRGLLTEEHEEWCEDAKFFTVPNICPFVKKCYEIVNSKRTDAIVSWSADGLNFVVHDPQRCADEVLPKYFKHANLMSWIRQLNKYGFRRVVRERPSDVNSQHGSASRGAGAGSSSRDGGDVALPAVGHPVGLVVSRPPEATTLHFQHPCFQRGNLTSLPSIRVQKTSDGGMSEATMSQMAAMGADTHRGRAKSTPVSSREGSEGMPAKSATRKRKISGSGHMDLSEHTAAGGFQNLVGMGNGMGYPAVGLPHAQQHYPAQVTHAVHMQQAQQVPGGHIFGGMQPGWGMQPPPPGSMHWGQSQGPPQQQQQQMQQQQPGCLKPRLPAADCLSGGGSTGRLQQRQGECSGEGSGGVGEAGGGIPPGTAWMVPPPSAAQQAARRAAAAARMPPPTPQWALAARTAVGLQGLLPDSPAAVATPQSAMVQLFSVPTVEVGPADVTDALTERAVRRAYAVIGKLSNLCWGLTSDWEGLESTRRCRLVPPEVLKKRRTEGTRKPGSEWTRGAGSEGTQRPDASLHCAPATCSDAVVPSDPAPPPGIAEISVDLELSGEIVNCITCSLPDNVEPTLLCDACNDPYHLMCAGLTRVPKSTWLCAKCEWMHGFVGKRFVKCFVAGDYEGKIASVNGFGFRVVYDDGDQEDIMANEMRLLVTDYNRKRKPAGKMAVQETEPAKLKGKNKVACPHLGVERQPGTNPEIGRQSGTSLSEVKPSGNSPGAGKPLGASLRSGGESGPGLGKLSVTTAGAVAKHVNGYGGDTLGSEGYGETTAASTGAMLILLKDLRARVLSQLGGGGMERWAATFDLNANSTFVDVGSGYGKVCAHVALVTQCRRVVGVECVGMRFDAAQRALDELLKGETSVRDPSPGGMARGGCVGVGGGGCGGGGFGGGSGWQTDAAAAAAAAVPATSATPSLPDCPGTPPAQPLPVVADCPLRAVEMRYGDATASAELLAATHVYAFDRVFSQGTLGALASSLSHCAFFVLVSFRTQKEWWSAGLCLVQPVAKLKMRTTGKENVTAYVYINMQHAPP